MEDFFVKENSWIAKVAALKLKATSVAIVFGKTIYLYNVSREVFLNDSRWLKHELCHVKQFKEHGFAGFIVKYIVESIRNGYYNNKFEAEARKAEEL